MAVKWVISPELNDGDSCGVCNTLEQVKEAIDAWCEQCKPEEWDVGDGFSVQAIEMSDEVYDSIPEG